MILLILIFKSIIFRLKKMDARAGENDTQTKLNRRKEAIKKTIRNQNHFHPKKRENKYKTK